MLLLTWAAAAALPDFCRAEPAFPSELLEDAHFRSEFGLNALTTPSISRVFDQLDELGIHPRENLRTSWPATPPRDRAQIALSLGGLIADGFFIVQSEDLSTMDAAGRAIVQHASALGAGGQFTRHSQALIEHGRAGAWNELRRELAATQRVVETELVMLRDIDLVRLISLGGWLRALEVACLALRTDFAPDRSLALHRVDITDYYLAELETLEPTLRKSPLIASLQAGLEQLHGLVELPNGAVYTADDIAAIHEVVQSLNSKP